MTSNLDSSIACYNGQLYTIKINLKSQKKNRIKIFNIQDRKFDSDLIWEEWTERKLNNYSIIKWWAHKHLLKTLPNL